MSHKNGILAAPARNHYFYGKLLDVQHFQMEQKYFNRKRWLMNQLGLGAGVLCGLELVVTDDGQKIWIQPGVAVDPYGHEIIVPNAYCLENPRQPTDPWGNPDGDPIAGAGVVTICLGYHECETDPVPVLVGDCDTEDECRPSTIRERYRVWVRSGEPEEAGGLTEEQCLAIFPRPEDPPDFDRRRVACQTLAAPCPEPGEDCVVLGTVILPEDAEEELVAETCHHRTVLYDNATLFDMLLCLADKVAQCCQVRQLRYIAGDGQTAEPGSALPEPLEVEVVDGAGDPVSGERVRWRVRAGGGDITPDSEETDANGRVTATWQLGPAAGHNKAEAYLDGGASVIFDATAVAEDGNGDGTGEPPIIEGAWLPNAAVLSPQIPGTREAWEIWQEQPRIELTFDREMNEEQLNSPLPWLRVWQLRDEGEIIVRHLKLTRIEPKASEGEFAVAYALQEIEPARAARYLVQIQARDDNIVEAGSRPRLLDAEFRGTRLSGRMRKDIWEISGEEIFGDRDIWEALIDTGSALPSGDGEEGGDYHGWFGISRGLGEDG